MKFTRLSFVSILLIISTSACSNSSSDNKNTSPNVGTLDANYVELPSSFDSRGISYLSAGMVLYFKTDVQLVGTKYSAKDNDGVTKSYLSVELFKKQLTDQHSRNCSLSLELESADSPVVLNYQKGQIIEIESTHTIGFLDRGNGFNSYVDFANKVFIGCTDYYDTQKNPMSPNDRLSEITVGEVKENLSQQISFAAKK